MEQSSPPTAVGSNAGLGVTPAGAISGQMLRRLYNEMCDGYDFESDESVAAWWESFAAAIRAAARGASDA